MERENPFYHSYHPPDELKSGCAISLERSIEFNHWNAAASELPELVLSSLHELEDKRKNSAELEQHIFEKIQTALQEWEAQAVKTLVLDKAIEYVKTPEVIHTSNEWKQWEDGIWEISNLTYKMCFEIWEDAAKPGTFLVSWSIGVNPPKRPASEQYYLGPDPVLVKQDRKRYETMEAAQRYIQGRFDLYCHLFTELRPPIPDGYQWVFTVHGCLLPHYTVEPSKRSRSEAIDELLDCLEETFTVQQPTKPAHPSKARKHGRKKPAPSR